MIGEGLHPRGMFGRIDGVEVPVMGTANAGMFGIPVESVSLRREFLPPTVTPLSGDNSSESPVVSVPRSAVTELGGWDWYALFQGEWCWVGNVQGERILIHTGSYATASTDPEWQGSRHSGWDRWVDADEVELEARWQAAVPAPGRVGDDLHRFADE